MGCNEHLKLFHEPQTSITLKINIKDNALTLGQELVKYTLYAIL